MRLMISAEVRPDVSAGWPEPTRKYAPIYVKTALRRCQLTIIRDSVKEF